MPVKLVKRGNAPHPASSRPAALSIGLLNNMPDQALERTERQFKGLLEAAAAGLEIELGFYSLPEIKRSAWGKRHLATHYSAVETIEDHALDALIVTGAEPKFAELADEPYWASLTRVFDWAAGTLSSVFLSCLAAHAAVFHFDGIRRHRLPGKRFGIFDHDIAFVHPLMEGAISPLKIPHSRWNEVQEKDLNAAGYRILTRSDAAGIDLFVKERAGLWLHFQGHPEYDPFNLSREYRRDVKRFLTGERPDYPDVPAFHFTETQCGELDAFRLKAMADRRPQLMSEFPIPQEARISGAPTNPQVTAIMANWLGLLSRRPAR